MYYYWTIWPFFVLQWFPAVYFIGVRYFTKIKTLFDSHTLYTYMCTSSCTAMCRRCIMNFLYAEKPITWLITSSDYRGRLLKARILRGIRKALKRKSLGETAYFSMIQRTGRLDCCARAWFIYCRASENNNNNIQSVNKPIGRLLTIKHSRLTAIHSLAFPLDRTRPRRVRQRVFCIILIGLVAK